MTPQDLQYKSALLVDLLRVIEHCYDNDEGRRGLSAVIASAQEHANDINAACDDLADNAAIREYRDGKPPKYSADYLRGMRHATDNFMKFLDIQVELEQSVEGAAKSS